MFADGGLLASKPYAASGAYINRMSDYCGACRYSPKTRDGDKACPITLLYWNFLIENRQKLQDNPRMKMPYRNLDRMDAKALGNIQARAQGFLERLSATADDADDEPQMSMDL